MTDRTGKLSLFLLFAGALALNLAGIRWGLPSAERNRLYFGNETALAARVNAVRAEVPGGEPEDRAAYLGAHLAPGAERAHPRSWYNPIRSYHPDEYFLIKSFASMNPGRLDFDPHQYSVGGAYLYPVGALIFLLSKLGRVTLTPDLGHYFYHPEDIAPFYVAGRALTALYGAGIVLFACLAAACLWQNRRAGLLAGVLTALVPLVMLNAKYMYADIPGVFWITLALYLCLRKRLWPTTAGYLAIGACAGLAAGSKLSFAAAFLLPLLLALSDRNTRRAFSGLAAAGAGFAFAFATTNPYFLLNFPASWRSMSVLAPFSFNGRFYFRALAHGLGLPVLLFCLAGFAWFLGRKNLARQTRLVPGGWVLAFFLFISLFEQRFARYILPVVPALIITGAGFWTHAAERRGAVGLAARGVILLVLLAAFTRAFAFLSLFTGENVRTTAGRWISENLPAATVIGVTEVPWQFQLPPLDETRYRVVVTGYDIAALRKAAPGYFLLSSFQAGIPPVVDGLSAERSAFWRRFPENGYQAAVSFQRPLSFAGITWPQHMVADDLLYLNPTITLFELREAAGP